MRCGLLPLLLVWLGLLGALRVDAGFPGASLLSRLTSRAPPKDRLHLDVIRLLPGNLLHESLNTPSRWEPVVVDGSPASERYKPSAGRDELAELPADLHTAHFVAQFLPELDPRAVLRLAAAIVHVDDPTVLHVVPTGRLAQPEHQLGPVSSRPRLSRGRPVVQMLENAEVSPLVVLNLGFRCLSPGEAVVTISLRSPDRRDLELDWAFRKVCRPETHTNEGVELPLSSGDYIPRLHVSSKTLAGRRLAEHGMSLPEFSAHIGDRRWNLRNPSRPVVPAGQSEIELELWLDAATVSERAARRGNDVLLGIPMVQPRSFGSAANNQPIARASPRILPELPLRQLQPGGDPVQLRLVAGCLEPGLVDLIVRIPVLPEEHNLALEFSVRKMCAEADGPAAADSQEPEVDPELAELCVGTDFRGQPADWGQLVRYGRTQATFVNEGRSDFLSRVPEQYQFITLYIQICPDVLERSRDSLAGLTVRVGPPELLADSPISDPVMSGRGSVATRLTPQDPYARLTISFHCLDAGNTSYSMLLPVDIQRPSGDGQAGPTTPRRVEFAFAKTCGFSERARVAALGGVGIEGLSVGFAKESPAGEGRRQPHEIVFDGFPQPAYSMASLAWDAVDETARDTTIAADVRVLRLTTAFARISDIWADSGTDLSEYDLETVEFLPPFVQSHQGVVHVELGGQMSQGGNLTRGSVWDLELRFECRLSGLDLLSVRLPLLPHGSINFVLRKACTGPDRPVARRLAALQIGSAHGSADIVLDGQPQPGFQPDRPTGQLWVEPASADTSTLYLEFEGEGGEPNPDAPAPIQRILAYEPLLSVHPTKMLDVWATHDFELVTRDGLDLLVIDEAGSALTISYDCLMPGTAKVTLTLISVEPAEGNLAFSWAKECPDTQRSPEELCYLYGLCHYEDPYDLYDAEDGAGDRSGWWSTRDDDYDFEEALRERSELASGPAVDGSLYSEYARVVDVSTTQPRYIDGAYPAGFRPDVVDRKLATPRFRASGVSDADAGEFHVVPADQSRITFWLSVPQKKQVIGASSVRSLPYRNRNVVKAALAGAVSVGGTLSPDAGAQPLHVDFQCVGTGPSFVVVTIPLHPAVLDSVSFRVLKICGQLRPKAGFLTANQRWLLFCLLVGLGGWWWWHRRRRLGKQGYRLVRNAPLRQQDFD